MRGPVNGRVTRALLGNDLRTWAQRATPWICLGIAMGTAGLALTGPPVHSAFRQALGGPALTVVDGQFTVGPGWTWLLVGVLLVVAVASLVDTPAAWTRLTLVRGVTRRQWAAARLGALALGALLYLAALVATLAVLVLLGHPGPLLDARTSWDVGLIALEFVSLAWFSLALLLVTARAWPALVVPLLLLGVARFGGNVSPYIPFAQSMASFHGQPGTLSVDAGAAYLIAWILLSGALVLWAAGVRLPDPDDG